MKSSNRPVSLTGVNRKWWDSYKQDIKQAMRTRADIFDEYETRAINNIFILENDQVLFGEPFQPSRKQFNFIRDMAEKARR